MVRILYYKILETNKRNHNGDDRDGASFILQGAAVANNQRTKALFMFRSIPPTWIVFLISFKNPYVARTDCWHSTSRTSFCTFCTKRPTAVSMVVETGQVLSVSSWSHERQPVGGVLSSGLIERVRPDHLSSKRLRSSQGSFQGLVA